MFCSRGNTLIWMIERKKLPNENSCLKDLILPIKSYAFFFVLWERERESKRRNQWKKRKSCGFYCLLVFIEREKDVSRRRKQQVLRGLVTNTPHKSLSVALSFHALHRHVADSSAWNSVWVAACNLQWASHNKMTASGRVGFTNNEDQNKHITYYQHFY